MEVSSKTYKPKWTYWSPMELADVLTRHELRSAKTDVRKVLRDSNELSGRELKHARLELEMLTFALKIQGESQ
jgi:hypothetical protein